MSFLKLSLLSFMLGLLSLFAMPAMAGETPAFCQPSGNMTLAMEHAADVKCAEYHQQIEDGTFRMTKSACTGGMFQVDAMGKSCQVTRAEAVIETGLVLVLATAFIEVGAGTLGGGEVGGVFYGPGGIFYNAGSSAAAVAVIP